MNPIKDRFRLNILKIGKTKKKPYIVHKSFIKIVHFVQKRKKNKKKTRKFHFSLIQVCGLENLPISYFVYGNISPFRKENITQNEMHIDLKNNNNNKKPSKIQLNHCH